MLEGLEVVEVKLKDILLDNEEFRIDADYYRKEYVSIYSKLANSPLLGTLVTMSDVSSNGCFKYVQDTLRDDYPKVIPYIRSGNVGDTFIDSNDLIRISVEAHAKLKLSVTKLYDVMMARKGKIGGASIITQNEANYNCNENVIKLSITDKKRFNPFYFTTFFNCKYGLKQIERLSTGNVQPWVSIFQIKKLKCFELPIAFQLQIEETIKSAHAKLRQSKTLYAEAENLLLEELGLKDWQPTNESVSIKSFSDFQQSGRLDAEYYQPKYEEIENKMKKYGVQNIEKCCKINDVNYTPKANTQYKYIELANIGVSGDITGCTETKGADLPSRAKRIVSIGDLLVSSIEGSLQSCAIVTNEYDNALCSTGFYVLTPQSLNVETLLLIFKSSAMQGIMKKGCSGTILTALSKDELVKLQLPTITENIQTQIAAKIQQSFALKAESKRLLDEAKAAVEREIETN